MENKAEVTINRHEIHRHEKTEMEKTKMKHWKQKKSEIIIIRHEKRHT